MTSGWSIPCIKIGSHWLLVIFLMILVSGNPLLEKSEYVEQRQNAGEDKNNVNTSETRGLEAQRIGNGHISIPLTSKHTFNDEQTFMSIYPDEALETKLRENSRTNHDRQTFRWTSRKEEFSFLGLVEKMFSMVGNGVTMIFNNFVTGESKNSVSSSKKVSYKDYQLLRIFPTTKSQVNDLRSLQEAEPDDIKFWTLPVKNRPTDILVSPNIIEDVKKFLTEQKMEFVILISDLQKSISHQNPKMSKEQRQGLFSNQGHSMTWKRYHRYGEILRYLEHLALRYPTLVELITIGNSYEGQPLKVVKVSSGPTEDGKTKPSIWIDAGMHAREWISIAVATYILSQLIEKNSTYPKLLENSDWIILPVANPDGYEFSHTTDRLWRKTRSSHADSENEARYTPSGIFHLVSHMARWFFSNCEGVDLNRNFDYHWGDAENEGTSLDPCHETYAGPKAFSEPETRAISDYIMTNRKNIRAYLTLHSYSQMWLVPWGYTYSKPADYADLMNVAKKATKAIAKVHGSNYQVGPSSKLLYLTTGASDDWAKGAAGIKYAYTVELRDRGTYGFLLPASQIVPTARETWAGIRAIARLVTSKV